MHGISYNLALIIAGLAFFAVTRWRTIVAWAVEAWRAWRRREPAPSPNDGIEPHPDQDSLVTSAADLSGESPSRASEGGPEEGAGKRAWPVVETRDGKVIGAWIKVDRQDRGDA